MVRKQNNSPCHEPPSTTTTATAGITRRKHRYPVDQAVDQEPSPEDSGVGCSGKSCRSCTAGVIADCVAVCCCPCAVVNFFTLTFLKLPWMMGRKCLLGLSKKRKKKIKNDDTEKDRSGISRKDEGVERKPENNLEEEVEKEEYSARFEAEKVWLELYKIDHLGFGRVSFTGIQSLE